MKKIKKHSIAILAFGILLVLLFNYFSEEDKTEPTEKTLTFNKKTSKSEATTAERIVTAAATPLFQQLEDCLPSNDKLQKSRYAWSKQRNKYFEEMTRTVNSEDLTRAMILIEGKYKAIGMRLSFSKRGYRTETEKNQFYAKRREMRESFGEEFFNGRELNWEFIFSLPYKERNEFLTHFGPEAEEVRNLIRTSRTKENIKEVIEISKNLSKVYFGVRVSEQYADNLFETLFLESRIDLLEHYLAAGGKIRTGEFGLNVLEKMMLFTPFKQLESREAEIKKLSSLGVKVRFNEYRDGALEFGQFLTHISRMYFPEIQKYKDIGFQFEQAQTVEQLTADGQVQQISKLIEEDKNKFLKGELKAESLDSYIECSSKKDVAQKVIYDEQVTADVQALIKEYHNDFEELSKQLFEIEPGLNDCHNQQMYRVESHHTFIKPEVSTKILMKVRESGIYAGIEFARSLGVSEKDMGEMFWSIVETSPQHARVMLEHGIFPSNVVGTQLGKAKPEVFSLLLEFGFSFDSDNKNLRTLVEAAAASCNAPLVEELFRLNSTYQLSEYRSDALAIALREPGCYGRNVSQMRINLLKAVLKFNPEIKDYHLRRVAEIRLANISDYKKIIGEIPALKIGSDIEPSGVVCSHLVFPNGDQTMHKGIRVN
ncbi:hypothetical protein [Aliikangiella coralliicola]|uniref:Uncharacterized protein n=1 Tax=Aliikangiella coralliicola TaxID=2592383 RepID=A0A545UIW7_9GAMM|nr:hypothetical protein [Aliikangiella coralliicola]TQV89410.1 hypothetical protein FLL46_00575 [Aliikangiella coralliicola]